MAEKKELSKSRQALVDKVLELFEGKKLSWEKSWQSEGALRAPMNAITGARYRGVNNALLYFTALERGYQDNRWLTYNQMAKEGLSFKKNEDGSTLGKGAGVTIEHFRLYDKLTKKDLDYEEFKKLTVDEQKKYWNENVKVSVQYHTVFNGDVVEGMPPLEKREHISEDERVERAEQMLRAWNDKQCPIIHDGGDNAYYSPMKDEIHLPQRTAFESLEAYYGTALHEVGHSTGHASRLNRDLTGSFGTELYAKEELRAEFASMFMKQELELSMSEKHLKNHTAYLQSWSESIKKDPDFLFDAIKDADKIVTCITDNAADFSATAQTDSKKEAQSSAESGAEISDKEKEKRLKKAKSWSEVECSPGGYAETSYEFFVPFPDMRLMKADKQDVWYIGKGAPGKDADKNGFFFDEKKAQSAFDEVKKFQKSEHSTRHVYNDMSDIELQTWIEDYGHNPITQEKSVWLSTAEQRLETLTEQSREQTEEQGGISPLSMMISNMPPEPNKEAAFVGSAVKENVSE